MTPRASKIVVITGVSRGLGLAMTEELIARGHTVCGCARNGQDVDRLRTRFATPHHFATVDVSRDEQVRSWAQDVLAAVGPPELLVNNAALMNRAARLWEVPYDEFSQLIDVNVKGVFSVLRHFLPSMVERQRGVVVNFSSGWGRSVSPEVAPYCASKWAIEGLTRALAEELPQEMAAVPLNPGVINTDMLRTAWGDEAASHQEPKSWAKRAVDLLLDLSAKDNGQPLAVRR
jgi:NAD(P)-dependent dehydrogenase (short-subunit alcohol dehydrogenase family)